MQNHMDLRRLPRLVRLFINYSGCYILGAGASAGVVPFGNELTYLIVDHYTRGGSFPADIPK